MNAIDNPSGRRAGLVLTETRTGADTSRGVGAFDIDPVVGRTEINSVSTLTSDALSDIAGQERNRLNELPQRDIDHINCWAVDIGAEAYVFKVGSKHELAMPSLISTHIVVYETNI